MYPILILFSKKSITKLLGGTEYSESARKQENQTKERTSQKKNLEVRGKKITGNQNGNRSFNFFASWQNQLFLFNCARYLDAMLLNIIEGLDNFRLKIIFRQKIISWLITYSNFCNISTGHISK